MCYCKHVRLWLRSGEALWCDTVPQTGSVTHCSALEFRFLSRLCGRKHFYTNEFMTSEQPPLDMLAGLCAL